MPLRNHSFIHSFHKFNVYVTYFILLHSGLQTPAIHELVYNSIKQCGIDMRRDLFANIILSGGSTLFPGKVVTFNSLIHVRVYVRMCVCVLCACVHAYVCVYVCMSVFVSIYLRMYVCVWICNFDFSVTFSAILWLNHDEPVVSGGENQSTRQTVRVYVCTYVCVCTYLSICLSLYVCMYI